jgi:UDP-glucose 6-dehydrogenase
VPRWTDIAKIHEGCGGQVRWVEAVLEPGIGFAGECLRCDATRLVVEGIIPIDALRPRDIREIPADELADIEWDNRDGWTENQERIAEQLDDYIDDSAL